MKTKIVALLLALCAVVAPQSTFAERFNADSTWVFEGKAGLNLNQASFSNWASGGDNTVGLNATFEYTADYLKEKHLFNNRLELAYGFNNTESVGNRKTNDKIYLSSIYGYEVGRNLYVSGTMIFQTQFANGYTYKDDADDIFTSTFMAPGYLTIGAGLTWTPKSWFTATLTPVTWKETFVLDDELSEAGAFGVEAGDKTLAEMGANLQLAVTKEIMKNVNLYSRLNLFSNYLEDPQNIDVEWEVQLSMPINSWLSASISTNLVYDDNIDILRKDGTVGQSVQFKENLGIGLSVAF